MLSDLSVMARRARAFRRFAFLLFIAATPALAQEQPGAVPQTREGVIAAERADKVAELWPERQNAMVDIANGLSERGLNEGLESGRGANGIQLLFGGMRSGQGMSAGLGYRRSFNWRYEVLYIWTRSRNTIDEEFATTENILNIRMKRLF